MIERESHIKPKSPERLQAQTEVFADSGLVEFSQQQRDILQNSLDLSDITDLHKLPPDIPDELRELIENNREAYIMFLKDRKYEIEKKEESIKLYKEKFQPVVADLKTRIGNGQIKKLPEYLGSGRNGSAFRIFVDGKYYAAKFSKSVIQSNFEIKPLIKAKGVEHVAQFVCHSFQDGVVIMDLLPGTDVTNFTPENAPEYTDKDIGQLLDTVVSLDSAGLAIDPKPSNFMYDPNQGFSVLDYHIKTDGGHYSLGQQMIDLIYALTARKEEVLDYDAPDYKERYAEQLLKHRQLLFPMMVRLVRAIKDNYPDRLEEWQQKYNKALIDPKVIPNDPLHKRYLDTNQFDGYIKELEDLGFKT